MNEMNCPNCNNSIYFLYRFFTSKLFPVTCKTCGARLYLDRYASSLTVSFALSIGLFGIIILAITKGFQFALMLLFCIIFLCITVFIAESIIGKIYVMDSATKRKKKFKSYFNSIIGLLFLLLAVALYLMDN